MRSGILSVRVKFYGNSISSLKFRHTLPAAARNFSGGEPIQTQKRDDLIPTYAMPNDSTLQTLILTGERHHEISRLRVEGVV